MRDVVHSQAISHNQSRDNGLNRDVNHQLVEQNTSSADESFGYINADSISSIPKDFDPYRNNANHIDLVDAQDSKKINQQCVDNDEYEYKYQKATTAYRQYLFSAYNVINNFLQDKPYNEYLPALRKIKLPPDVIDLIQDLHLYSGYRVTKNHVIFPANYKLIASFIKIERISEAQLEKNNLKKKIVSNLHILSDFLYSKELQTQFLR
ncbi:MAG: hypothetical protein AB8B67_03035 [Rickettsiaceae bacterium]